uniref:Uncharacterized protein n=1 Tax=Chenopodium quinoa TaxID=63459 RepID=A0A803N467_CHEQI
MHRSSEEKLWYLKCKEVENQKLKGGETASRIGGHLREAVVFEVQRSGKSEAKKAEKRLQELELAVSFELKLLLNP